MLLMSNILEIHISFPIYKINYCFVLKNEKRHKERRGGKLVKDQT